MDNTPNPLKAAIERWAEVERHERESSLPAPEALVAYYEDQLDPESRRVLRRQLALDPEAAREYVDLAHFDELEPPTEDHRLTDQDVAAALAAVRGKVMPADRVAQEQVAQEQVAQEQVAQEPAVPRAAPRTTGTAPNVDSLRSLPRQPPANSIRLYQQIAMAAGILVALGVIWIGALYQELDRASAPRYSQVFDISVTRGAGSTSVAKQGEQILLLIHDADLEEYTRGELEITNRQGEVLLNRRLNATTDATVPLSLPVARDLFPDGAYRIVLYGLDENGRHVTRDYRWQLESEPTG